MNDPEFLALKRQLEEGEAEAQAEARKPVQERKVRDPSKPANYVTPYSVSVGASALGWLFGRP
ncbi:MAG: hypothetical protein E7K72_00605 [Roseomonas mucosa]|nr:hypothetical protein [Roseomonas mucosa]